MPRIHRHETVSLDSGGWIDLGGCDLLWAYRTVGSLVKPPILNAFFPAGIWFARKKASALLLRTPQGAFVVKELVGPVAAFTAQRIVWRQVTEVEAFLWLQQMSRRHAKRLFPDLHAQQQHHQLGGER